MRQRAVVTIDSVLAKGELELADLLHYCQHDGCHARPTRLCLCGCDRQLCTTHEEAEHLARQCTMARHMIAHRTDRDQVHQQRARRGEDLTVVRQRGWL